MGSVIADIYTAIAAITVTVDGKTPQAYGLAEAKNSYASGDLPVRILMSLSGGLQGQEMRFETISGSNPATGNQQNINWQVEELMLWLPQGQGRGGQQVTPALVEYAGKYIDAVRPVRLIGTRASVENLSVDVGIFAYPDQGTLYYGCMCRWTIKELP